MYSWLKERLRVWRGRRFLRAAGHYPSHVLQKFLDKGVDPNFHEESKTTALVLVANVHDTRSVLMLLDRGADPNIRNTYGATALLWAARNADRISVKALLAKGANPNLQNSYGLTPLMLAARNGDRVSTRMLLARGAHLDLENEVGQTAFGYAEENGHGDILDILEEALSRRIKGAGAAMDVSARVKKRFGDAVRRRPPSRLDTGKPKNSWKRGAGCTGAVKI